jgi:hypothetical protein
LGLHGTQGRIVRAFIRPFSARPLLLSSHPPDGPFTVKAPTTVPSPPPRFEQLISAGKARAGYHRRS